MARERRDFSGYRHMWLFAMFDLPVTTPEARREYVRFRNTLLSEGFMMLQYSVYARPCAGEDAAKAHRRRLRAQLPPGGEVRLLSITDKQFGKMEVFHEKSRGQPEQPPQQLAFF